MTNRQKTKDQLDNHAKPHSFKISDKVLVANDFDTTKNQTSPKMERASLNHRHQ
jgi:hypothetical protein